MVKEKTSIFSNFKFKLFLVIAIVIITSISITFGFFYTGHSQTGTSGINTLSCFDTTFSDGDSINLTKALSMSDELGLKTDPYTFTITNNCDTGTNYYVILNVKENSFSADYINYSLNDKTPSTLSSAEENTYFNIPEGYTKSYVLDKGTLAKGVPKTYDTRLWINASTTYEQVQGKTFEAQIKVVSVVKELDNILYPTFVSTLLSKANAASITDYNSGVKTEMYTFSHPEAEQTTGWSEEERTDYRYIGNTPNNYVTFNDEVWRIIGVFTVENESGEKEQRIKMIRYYAIGQLPWDTKSDETYTNEWPTSSLSTMLNGDYISKGGSFNYNFYYYDPNLSDSDPDGPLASEDPDTPAIDPDEPEIELGISYTAKSPTIKMLSASSNTATINGLNSTAQDQIAPVKWYLGGNSTYENLGGPDYYSFERGLKVYSGHSTSVIAKVGLIYPSDYVYTFALGVDNICYSNGCNCYNGPATWLDSSGDWTITPNSSNTDYVFFKYIVAIMSGEAVYTSYTAEGIGVRPTVYLRSDIEITGGDGSSGNPYTLGE